MALVYSCCFWFSLRLGGILIGLFSFFQGILFLTSCSIAYSHAEDVEAELQEWYKNWDLIYFKEYLENMMQDPKKYISSAIGISCVYLVSCVLYVYGAYICNNILMFGFILLELIRLILISITVATGLLLLKQNTMDIGLLIGASVVGGFFLLGMFYLWVCATSLPVLINEMERDEQAAMIAKLQQQLESSQRRSFRNNRYGTTDEPNFGQGVFVIRKQRYRQSSNKWIQDSSPVLKAPDYLAK